MYGGRVWNKHESNWSVTEQELAGIIFAIERSTQLFLGRKFYIITDHLSNVYVNSLKHSHGKLYRWSLRLQNYNLEIEHISGNEMPANFLSRIVAGTDKSSESTLDDDSNLVFALQGCEPDTVESEILISPRPLRRHKFARTHKQRAAVNLSAPSDDTSQLTGTLSVVNNHIKLAYYPHIPLVKLFVRAMRL